MKLKLTSLLPFVLSVNTFAQTPNFFDDFETGTMAKWSLESATPPSISTYTNKVPEGGTYSALYPSSAASMFAIFTALSDQY